MEKTLRRITYSFFFLLFFILAPLLTVYALGYRYDFQTGNIEKNGAFYVKSYPKGASIYVGGKKAKNTTPTQVLNIQPGKYELRVSKKDYVDWVKELEIKSGETTFAEDIVLFLSQRPETTLGTGSENYLINHNRDKYAYIDADNTLMITDVEQAKNFELSQLEENYTLLDWSPDNQRILMEYNSAYFVFDINQKTVQPLTIEKADKIFWEDNANTLLYLNNGQLFRHYLSAGLLPEQESDQALNLEDNINDFALYDNWLIVHYSIGPENFVVQLDKNNLREQQKIAEVNLGNLDTLLADDNYLIFSLGSTLYIKPSLRDLVTIPMTIAKIHDERLLLTNGHEILLFNYKQDWQSLIDRSSNIISDLLWHPNGSYFVYESNDLTKLSELDGRDKRNTIELLNNPRKKMYLFNKKGDQLFVLTPEKNFYLTIQ